MVGNNYSGLFEVFFNLIDDFFLYKRIGIKYRGHKFSRQFMKPGHFNFFAYRNKSKSKHANKRQ